MQLLAMFLEYALGPLRGAGSAGVGSLLRALRISVRGLRPGTFNAELPAFPRTFRASFARC